MKNQNTARRTYSAVPTPEVAHKLAQAAQSAYEAAEAAKNSKPSDPSRIHALIPDREAKMIGAKIPVKLTLGDHRLRFHSAGYSTIDLQIVGPVSLKEPLRFLYAMEKQPCEIVNVSAFLRIYIMRRETCVNFTLRYSVKVQTGKGRYTIQEKEQSFTTDAPRDTVIYYGDRYIQKIHDDEVIQRYHDWAHPLTLEAVTASLTEDQKRKAAKLLQAYFAA